MGWRRGERDIVQEQRSSNGDMREFIPCCYVVRHITARMRIWLGKRELRGRGRNGFNYVRYERRVRRTRRDLARRDLARRVLRPPFCLFLLLLLLLLLLWVPRRPHQCLLHEDTLPFIRV